MPYTEDKPIRYEWISPQGKVHASVFTVKSGWSSTWVRHIVPTPLEEGTWQLALFVEDRQIITGRFVVSAKPTLLGKL